MRRRKEWESKTERGYSTNVGEDTSEKGQKEKRSVSIYDHYAKCMHLSQDIGSRQQKTFQGTGQAKEGHGTARKQVREKSEGIRGVEDNKDDDARCHLTV